jgi:hypothetical protein
VNANQVHVTARDAPSRAVPPVFVTQGRTMPVTRANRLLVCLIALAVLLALALGLVLATL